MIQPRFSRQWSWDDVHLLQDDSQRTAARGHRNGLLTYAQRPLVANRSAMAAGLELGQFTRPPALALH